MQRSASRDRLRQDYWGKYQLAAGGDHSVGAPSTYSLRGKSVFLVCVPYAAARHFDATCVCEAMDVDINMPVHRIR